MHLSLSADVQGIKMLLLSEAVRKETCENPSRGGEQHLGRFLATGTASRTQLTRRKGRWGRQLHTKCLDVPWRHRSCLPAQSFVSLSPGLQKSICVFLKVRRHQKYSVCCNTNTGSASVLRNQIKALKAANYAMEDFKNPWKHCSSCLKCPHAGVRRRNGCFNIQHSQGAIPSQQFNFRKKYKNTLILPGELN